MPEDGSCVIGGAVLHDEKLEGRPSRRSPSTSAPTTGEMRVSSLWAGRTML